MSLTVIHTSCLTAGVRGSLNQWLVEVGPGTYVGTPNPTIRSQLWRWVATAIDNELAGTATMVVAAQTEQGYVMLTHGDSRYRVDEFDGLQLVTFIGEGTAKPDTVPYAQPDRLGTA